MFTLRVKISDGTVLVDENVLSYWFADNQLRAMAKTPDGKEFALGYPLRSIIWWAATPV